MAEWRRKQSKTPPKLDAFLSKLFVVNWQRLVGDFVIYVVLRCGRFIAYHMNTSKVNDRLWTICKFGVPATLILLVIAALMKFRILIIATDLIGLGVMLALVGAILTEFVLFIEKNDKASKRPAIYGDEDEGPADR
jgi:hypothetical protein